MRNLVKLIESLKDPELSQGLQANVMIGGDGSGTAPSFLSETP